MTAPTLAQRVADAFNQHGKFTARPVENGLAVEVRHVDDGKVATKLWLPDDVDGWCWQPSGLGTTYRDGSRNASVEEIVRAVATSVLDERRS